MDAGVCGRAVRERMRWAGVDDFPYALVTAIEKCHFAKPHPEYFAEVLARLDKRPDEALVVGNDWEADMVPAARLGSLELANDAKLFYVILPITVLLLMFAKNLFRTRVGKAFVAIRDQDISAEVMGVNVFKHKLLSFGVSSFYVGVAGSLLAYQARIISPENFPISLAIDQLGMIIIGGLGSVQGSIFGAVFITLLPELLRLATGELSAQFPALTAMFAPLRTGLFGLVIVLFLVFEPDGLAARWRLIKAYWKLYPFSY